MKIQLHGIPPWLRLIKVRQQCSINNPHVLGVDHDHGLIQPRPQERKVVDAVPCSTSQHSVFEHLFGPSCEALSGLTNLNETEHLHQMQLQQLKNLCANRAHVLFRMSAGKSTFHQADVLECDSDGLCSRMHHGHELRTQQERNLLGPQWLRGYMLWVCVLFIWLWTLASRDGFKLTAKRIK